ncbi:MAG: alpha-amylase family glycosyl hydrolase [bacterium]
MENRGQIVVLLLIVCIAGACRHQIPLEKTRREKFNRLRIYQIMVEAFVDGDPLRNYEVGYGTSHHRGDLKGVTKALPYIKSLGMNAIWLTPIFDSEKGHGNDPKLDATGYFTRNYFQIDPNFGTLTDAKEMVNTAHKLGLYVFLDGVFEHHKGEVRPSPKGRLPVGPKNAVQYPESLEFYKEVATYWIDELEIDGWRLDQAYRVPIESWQEIRQAVERQCRQRRQAGKKWGTLGYMVAEIWSTAEKITSSGYGSDEQPGLFSAFDFPLRYNLVQVLAVEEKGFGHQPASVLNDGFKTHELYPVHASPNLMLSNHDLVRFGDLIQRAGYPGNEHPHYWQRHKAAFSFLAAYTGPITVYYGDEIGAEVPGFTAKVEEKCWEIGLCDDHVSRISGKIAGFDSRELDLQNYVKALMQLREEYPALWNGARQNIRADQTLYADIKTYQNEQILYLLNTATHADTVVISQKIVGGQRLENILSKQVYFIEDGKFTLHVEGLTGIFLKIE